MSIDEEIEEHFLRSSTIPLEADPHASGLADADVVGTTKPWQRNTALPAGQPAMEG